MPPLRSRRVNLLEFHPLSQAVNHRMSHQGNHLLLPPVIRRCCRHVSRQANRVHIPRQNRLVNHRESHPESQQMHQAASPLYSQQVSPALNQRMYHQASPADGLLLYLQLSRRHSLRANLLLFRLSYQQLSLPVSHRVIRQESHRCVQRGSHPRNQPAYLQATLPLNHQWSLQASQHPYPVGNQRINLLLFRL
jgi:hypothetical protein